MSHHHHNSQVRTYVRLFPSLGIDQILDNSYEILDGHTFYRKNDKKQTSGDKSTESWKITNCQPNSNGKKQRKYNKKYTMHTFNYIFNHQFQNVKQIQHINLIDDCFEGKDQLIFLDIAKQFTQSFLIGTHEDPGFLISIFTSIFNQTHIDVQSGSGQSQVKWKGHKSQSITLSAFSTESNTNRFLDLILGQKFIFYSKKDMDQHKDFYSKQIKQLHQFLILLKIITLHYKQCCKQADPIVFRIIVDSYDEILSKRHRSTLLLVLCQIGSKLQADMVRKIQFRLRCGSVVKGEDHGSLVNYLERYFRKSKFVFVFGIPFRKSVMENSSQMFEFLAELKAHQFSFQNSVVDMDIYERSQILNNFYLPKCRLSRNLNHKEINQAIVLLQKFAEFLTQSQLKWQNYCQIFMQILAIQKQFYERQQFPISLQIQEFNIKSYLISKIYRLSETYIMDDLSPQMQKIRTIKNQIILSFKALNNSKQLLHFRSNPRSQQFLKYYDECLLQIYHNLKSMFSIRYRCIQVSELDLTQLIKVQKVLDSALLKNLAQKLNSEAKKIKEREQILFRSLNTNAEVNYLNNNILNTQPTQSRSFQKQHLNGTKTFELFKRNRRIKQKSDLCEIRNRAVPLCGVVTVREKQKESGQQGREYVNGSTVCTKPINIEMNRSSSRIGYSHYSFSLPKIAIIHRKKHIR